MAVAFGVGGGQKVSDKKMGQKAMNQHSMRLCVFLPALDCRKTIYENHHWKNKETGKGGMPANSPAGPPN